MSAENVYLVAILGGGVAGQTAGVFAGQANLLPACVLEGDQFGGALALSHSVRNWPGVLDAPGGKIVDDIRAQAAASGVESIGGTATRVDLRAWPRVVEWKDHATGKTRVLRAYAVVLATGREPRRLTVPGERENFGRGVSTCAICEGSQYRDKTVVVVGGGDGAIAEAEYLSNLAATVYLVVRGPSFRARLARTRERVAAKANVRVLFQSEVVDIKGNGRQLAAVTVRTPQGPVRIEAQGLFEAIGSTPRSELFRGQIDLDGAGHALLRHHQQTSVDGVYAAGDLVDHAYALAPKAADEASVAALQAGEFLQERGVAGSAGEKKQERAEERGSVRALQFMSDLTNLVEAGGVVVVDVYIERCQPCKLLSKVLDGLVQEFAGRVSFVKFDAGNDDMLTDSVSEYARGLARARQRQDLNLDRFPTLLFWNQGRLADVVLGGQSRDDMLGHLERLFGY